MSKRPKRDARAPIEYSTGRSYTPMRYGNYQGNGGILRGADDLRRSMLREADLLDTLGNPAGASLRRAAEELPLASLERIRR